MKNRNETYAQKMYEEIFKNFKKVYKDEDKIIFNQCLDYIKKYFIQFDKKFNDLSITRLLSISERDTKIIRTRYGVYTEGNNQSLDDIGKQFGLSLARIGFIIDEFNNMLWDDIYNKVYYIMFELKRGNVGVLSENIVGIAELGLDTKTYRWLRKKGCFVSDITKMTKSELKKCKMIGKRAYEDIVYNIERLGYHFPDDIGINGETDIINTNISVQSEESMINNALRCKIDELVKTQKQINEKQREEQIILDQIKLLQVKSSLLTNEISELLGLQQNDECSKNMVKKHFSK